MPPLKKVTPPVARIDFLSLTSPIYTGGFTLPEGKYALFFEVLLQQPKEGGRNQNPRLGVELTAYSLEKAGEPSKQFLSMGTKAHESFVPSEDGRGLASVVGGSGTVTNKSNWSIFLKSLQDCGVGTEVEVSNDLSVLDGVWVQTTQIPEPEERKGFATQTGEVQESRPANAKIPVVTEILEGGKPWEGGGGMPEFDAKPAGKAPLKMPVKAGVKVAPKAAAAAEVVESDATDAEQVQNAAVNAITTIMTDKKYEKGCPKLILKTGTFKAVEAAEGKEMASAVTSTYFGSDDDLSGLLGQMGYSLVGTTVKSA